MIRLPAHLAVIVAIAFAAPAALAHPKLAAASPAPNSTVASPRQITLRFTETLLPRFSGAELIMTDMPGMKMHAPTKMPATARVVAGGKTLTIVPARPLAAGTYKISYHVVASDSHRISAGYAFRVR